MLISTNPFINTKILWLLEIGCPPIPIAPRQDRFRYPKKGSDPYNPKPKFTGKNPSFLLGNGRPVLLQHRQYWTQFPRLNELQLWFNHPLTGVGTLGGWGDIVWIDIDSKFFPTIEHCWQVVRAYLEWAKLTNTYIDRTQSGGARIGVRLKRQNVHSFARKISFRGDGRIIGESIGTGANAILSPTQGEKGWYQPVQFKYPASVESLPAIGLYPGRKVKPIPFQNDLFQPRSTYYRFTSPHPSAGGGIDFELIAARSIQVLIDSLYQVEAGNRSDVLCAIAREAFGWETILHEMGAGRLQFIPEQYILGYGRQMGLEDDRIWRIMNSCSYGQPIRNSVPRLYFHQGTEGCRKRALYMLRKSA